MIPIAEPLLGQEELDNVIEAVKSGWISSKGKYILEFEEKFALYCGAKYGVATSNGTAALHLALTALGIGRGDEVIVPTLTFIATANAVRYTGAKPVFVDSHPNYWCINQEKMEDAITSQTRAIIPVHLYGHPCDMDPILDITKKHNLYLIEDAAEAHGAEYKGKRVGSFGDISCFSFYANKIISTGEGGICLTNNEDLAKRMRILRDHGMNPERRYWYDIIGFNYRMTNIQAAIGVAQLEKIDKFIEKKRNISKRYHDGLKKFRDKGLINLHPQMPWAKCVFWMYCILVEDKFSMSRDDLIKGLEEKMVETRPFFYPMHMMPPYINSANLKLRNAEKLSRQGINLPSSVNLNENNLIHILNSLSEMFLS